MTAVVIGAVIVLKTLQLEVYNMLRVFMEDNDDRCCDYC